MIEPTHSNTIVGWREWVALPCIGVPWIKAKIDSGAQSSALHADDIEEFIGTDGKDWVRFQLKPWQNSDADAAVVECQIHDRRAVRSSSGHSEDRIVVLIDVELGGHTVAAETTLTNRDEMGFRMLVGREALSQGYLVDSDKSFLGGRAPRDVRRRNQGRA